jgi:hypothetical protein
MRDFYAASGASEGETYDSRNLSPSGGMLL